MYNEKPDKVSANAGSARLASFFKLPPFCVLVPDNPHLERTGWTRLAANMFLQPKIEGNSQQATSTTTMPQKHQG
jgi:hypothetical protein